MPCEFVTLMGAFAPLFSKPVFQHVHILLVGAILSPGKRTVTQALRVMGKSQDAHFPHSHRMLNRAVWSSLAAGRILLGLLISAFALRGARFPGLQLLWADGGSAGKLVAWVATVLQRTLVIVKRPRHTRGFQVLQWRWIVERTFGWLNRSRRLSKDFEALPATTETWIRIAMIQLMVRRLAAST